jgi:fermentation-respiration switch protein FrsA (DUF1100 family)
VSYGGFLALVSSNPDFFACAIEALGMPDLEGLYRETTAEGRAYLERELGPLRGNLTLYRELSPVSSVSRVRTPLLSFHGEIYPLVPYSTKKAFFDALRQRAGYRLQEYIFKGEEARATYRHDLHPEAAWAYVERSWSSWKSTCEAAGPTFRLRFRQHARCHRGERGHRLSAWTVTRAITTCLESPSFVP